MGRASMEMGFRPLIARGGDDRRQCRPDPLPAGFLGCGYTGEALGSLGPGGQAAVVETAPVGEGHPLAGVAV